MMKREERKRIKKIPNLNLNPNLKEKIKKMQNPKKNHNVNSNDLHMSINPINIFFTSQ